MQRTWGLLGLAAFFIIIHLLGQNLHEKLRQQHRYTVGTIYGTHWTTKAGKFAGTRFFVAGKKYTVNANADALVGQVLVGRRFLVEFHPPDPTYSVLYLEAPIPEWLATPPSQGWDTVPFAVPEHVLLPAK
ncbi:MAG: hypothetical protein EOO55_02825 [Hymenobacter sp.]|nr:MAG: hypothetical protein EOO55_02825 [Hymenobacter sp.]